LSLVTAEKKKEGPTLGRQPPGPRSTVHQKGKRCLNICVSDGKRKAPDSKQIAKKGSQKTV